MRKAKFKVQFDLPEGETIQGAREYVQAAIESWAGSLRPPGGYSEDDPGDPMFGLDRESVKVSLDS